MSSTPLNESISAFYAGKSVFITGGTGFVGKVFIEKLLYSCPQLSNIYLLIRGKNLESPEKRLQNMLKLPIFTRLKQNRPGDLAKIIPIVGDITQPNLGIEEDDLNLLLEKINVVLHVAATVMFNEPLEDCMNINFEGTRSALNISKKMRNLQAFVYVSTAYTNTERDAIKEVIYPAPAQYEDVFASLKKHGNDKKITRTLLNGHPNTYTFTKALAESYVAENHGGIPAVIVRPSIVTGSKNEPLEGWVDNWFGATGTMTMVGKGFLRVYCGKDSNILDLIPVDYVSNLVIVAAARCSRSEEVKVYNCCSSSVNPVTIGTTSRSFIAETVRLKLNDIPYPTISFTEKKWLINLIIFFTQMVPAILMDCFCLITGKRQRYYKQQVKLQRLHKSQQYFTSNSWIIESEQTQALHASLSDFDKNEFQFDVSNIVWDKYFRTYYNGIKTYLLK